MYLRYNRLRHHATRKLNRVYSRCSRMYANFVFTCPSTMTSGHFALRVFEPSPYLSSMSTGRSLSSFVQCSMLCLTLSPVNMIPTWGSSGDSCSCLAPKCFDNAMWCSARTRLDIREMSIRLMNESSWSGGRCGELRERPSDKFGMTVALCTSKKCLRMERTIIAQLLIQKVRQKVAKRFIFNQIIDDRISPESNRTIRMWHSAEEDHNTSQKQTSTTRMDGTSAVLS